MTTTETTDPRKSDTLSPSLGRALIRSLTRGTTIAVGARYIHVGHSKWLAAQKELLIEIAEDGYADTKFVRGAYGAGKSHFLTIVQDLAHSLDWATSHVECKADGVQIDRFETLYPRILAKLKANDMSGYDQDGSADPARCLLEKWARNQIKKAGLREDGLSRPFDADERLYNYLDRGLLRSNLPTDFVRAVAGFARAHLARDVETTVAISGWIAGIRDRIGLAYRYVKSPALRDNDDRIINLRPIGKGTARDAMRGLLWLIRSAGYSGLVLCIDEVEELAKLGSRKRQDQALQALREYVDHAGGEGGFRNLCMYLAATPEMFEGEEYFPRYDALATRIQAVGNEVNWRGPVIDLDRTPLTAADMLTMASRICEVHRIAYEQPSSGNLNEGEISVLVQEVVKARFRIAKPRLLARVMVDLLERGRQQNSSEVASDPSELVAVAATRIIKELEK